MTYERREHVMGVRVTKRERQYIERFASRARKLPATWLRDIVYERLQMEIQKEATAK